MRKQIKVLGLHSCAALRKPGNIEANEMVPTS